MSSLALPLALYGVSVTPVRQSDILRLRRNVAAQEQRLPGSPDALLTLFVKGHLVDPLQAVPVAVLGDLRRQLLQRPELRAAAAAVWRWFRGREAAARGPVGLALVAIRRLGWAWPEWERWARTGLPPLEVWRGPGGCWRHAVREGARRMVWRRAGQWQDSDGLAAVDRHATLAGWRRLGPWEKALLRSAICGAADTQFQRRLRQLADSATCPRCGQEAELAGHPAGGGARTGGRRLPRRAALPRHSAVGGATR